MSVKYPTHLPDTNALCPNAEGSLEDTAEFEGVGTDLYEVVEESAHGSQRESRREESHIAKLDKHLQVVLKGALVLWE